MPNVIFLDSFIAKQDTDLQAMARKPSQTVLQLPLQFSVCIISARNKCKIGSRHEPLTLHSPRHPYSQCARFMDYVLAWLLSQALHMARVA